MIAFFESCHVGYPEEVLHYRINDDNSTQIKEYSATLINKLIPPPELNIKYIDKNKIKLITIWMSKMRGKGQSKLLNSLRWFHKALQDTPSEDKFMYLWIAMEQIDDLIKSKYKLDKIELRPSKCRHCGHEIKVCPECNKDFCYPFNLTVGGFKEIENKLQLNKKIVDLIKDRHKLFHSGLEPSDLKLNIEVCHKLLRRAVYELLEIDDITMNILMQLSDAIICPTIESVIKINGPLEFKENLDIDDYYKQPMLSTNYSYEFKVKNEKVLSSKLLMVNPPKPEVIQKGKVAVQVIHDPANKHVEQESEDVYFEF